LKRVQGCGSIVGVGEGALVGGGFVGRGVIVGIGVGVFGGRPGGWVGVSVPVGSGVSVGGQSGISVGFGWAFGSQPTRVRATTNKNKSARNSCSRPCRFLLDLRPRLPGLYSCQTTNGARVSQMPRVGSK
jgi:hypothetical protein